MKIKYKDTEIYRGYGNALCVEYLYDDPDHNPPKRKQNKFFFNFSMVHHRTDKIDRLHFKAGMDWAPQRMKVTMEDLKVKFKEFKDNGGGTIEDFLNLLTSYERNEKLNQLGI